MKIAMNYLEVFKDKTTNLCELNFDIIIPEEKSISYTLSPKHFNNKYSIKKYDTKWAPNTALNQLLAIRTLNSFSGINQKQYDYVDKIISVAPPLAIQLRKRKAESNADDSTDDEVEIDDDTNSTMEIY